MKIPNFLWRKWPPVEKSKWRDYVTLCMNCTTKAILISILRFLYSYVSFCFVEFLHFLILLFHFYHQFWSISMYCSDPLKFLAEDNSFLLSNQPVPERREHVTGRFHISPLKRNIKLCAHSNGLFHTYHFSLPLCVFWLILFT